MVGRFLLSIAVGFMCVGVGASAADLPTLSQPKKPVAQILQKKPSVKIQAPSAKKTATKSLKTNKKNSITVLPDVIDAAEPKEVDLAWVLDPLVATADGSKKEGSASVEGNLLVLEPGYVTSPYMIIELTGHVVKTEGSTARIDINVAGKARQVTWDIDEVKSGAFTIRLNETLSEGNLPAYFPVSAIAFATKAKRNAVVMVSLGKVRIRIGKIRIANNE